MRARTIGLLMIATGCGSAQQPSTTPETADETQTTTEQASGAVALWTFEGGAEGTVTWTPEPGTTLTVRARDEESTAEADAVHDRFVPIELAADGSEPQRLEGCPIDPVDGSRVEAEVRESALIVRCVVPGSAEQTTTYDWQDGAAVPQS